jgi:hypothetical protein
LTGRLLYTFRNERSGEKTWKKSKVQLEKGYR